MATFLARHRFTPTLSGRYVAYLRSSSAPHSRLDACAQRRAISDLLDNGRTKIIDTFTEIEPLAAGARPALVDAAAACNAENATLIIGRLDHMRAGMKWMTYLKKNGVRFLGADAPYLNQMAYFDLKMEDFHWREDMRETVQESLARAKSRGVKLGGKRGSTHGLKLGPEASAKSRKNSAWFRDARTMLRIKELRHLGIAKLPAIATRLNQLKHPAPRGGEWSPNQVRRVIRKFED